MKKGKLQTPQERLSFAYAHIILAVVYIIVNVLETQGIELSDIIISLMIMSTGLPTFLTHRQYKKYYDRNNKTTLAIPESQSIQEIKNDELEKELIKEDNDFKRFDKRVRYSFWVTYFIVIIIFIGSLNNLNYESLKEVYPLFSLFIYIPIVLLITYKIVLKHREKATLEKKITVCIFLFLVNIIYAYSIIAANYHSWVRFNIISIVSVFTLLICVYLWIPKKRNNEITNQKEG